MIVLLLLLLFILCYVYIRYTELKNKDLTVDGTVCDVIGELIALMIFADNKREFKEYEVATTAINHRFKISVSDKVKTSILEYYNQQMVVELDSDRIDRTKAEIATVSEPLGKLSASDRLAIMEVLCCVAKVSGFKKSEWELFKLIGAQLNIADNEMNRYHLFFEPHLLNTASAEDYAALGLTPDASQQDVLENLLPNCKVLNINTPKKQKVPKETNWKQKFQKPQNENICLTYLNTEMNGNFHFLSFCAAFLKVQNQVL